MILDALEVEAREILKDRDEEDLRIDNIILGKTLYTMKGEDAVFGDMNFCLILLENAYGFSYFQEEIDYSLRKLVNKSILNFNEDMPQYVRVAALDAMYCLVNNKTLRRKKWFKGDLRKKASMRARVLLSGIPKGSNILLLGAVSEIIEESQFKRCHIKVLDLEPQKIGLKLHSVDINKSTADDLEQEIGITDYIVATGMIFSSGTADQVFELAKKYNKRLILFMQTGSNFGPQLINHGASLVLSEFFPYYDFFGETRYFVSK